jgi:hypothetical protein
VKTITNNLFINIFIFLIAVNAYAQQIPLNCSGIPNIEQKTGELIAGPFLTNGGRTAVIGFHQGCLWVVFESAMSKPGSDNISQICSISDPSKPLCRPSKVPRDTVYNFHGFLEEGRFINFHPNQWWSFKNGEPTNSDGPFPTYTNKSWDAWGWGRGLLFQPWAVRSYWTEYSATNSPSELFLGNTKFATWSPRVRGHAFLFGNMVYFVGDRSTKGIDAYDITPSLNSPGTPPRLVGSLNNSLVGGYDPSLWGTKDKLKVVIAAGIFSRKIQVIDVTDPTNMKVDKIIEFAKHSGGIFDHDPNPNYIQFQDNFGFSDTVKVDLDTNIGTVILDPAPNRINTTQFSLPVGNLLVTGGIHWGHSSSEDSKNHSRQGVGIWAHQNAPDTRPPAIGYHLPKRNQRNYPIRAPISVLIHETLRSETITMGDAISLKPVLDSGFGSEVPARAVFAYNDILTITPNEPLATNTTYEVSFIEGRIKDSVGNGILPYSFRFSTGINLIEGITTVPPTPTVNKDLNKIFSEGESLIENNIVKIRSILASTTFNTDLIKSANEIKNIFSQLDKDFLNLISNIDNRFIFISFKKINRKFVSRIRKLNRLIEGNSTDELKTTCTSSTRVLQRTLQRLNYYKKRV